MAQQLPQIHSVHSSQRRPAHGSARPAAPSLLSRVPWGFLAVVAVLVAYGLVVCWSAVQGDADYNFTRQLQGVAVGLVAMVALWAFDYRRLSNLTTALLVINVVLILLPHIPGLGTDAGMGAKSWIKIGMQVQPGEFAKVTVVLFAASLLARYQGTLDDWREYCKVLGMLLVPFAAIMTQPDLGTGLVYLAISAVVLVMGGAKGALPAHHAYRRHRGHRGRVRRRRAAEVPAVRRHVGVPPLEELPAQPPARVPEPRGGPLRRRLQPRPGQDCHRQRWPVRQGHRQRHAVDPRLSARGPHGLHLLRSGRGVRVRGRHGAHRPVRPAHRGVPLHRPARRQPLRHAHRHGASSACGSSRFWRTSAWTAALCPSRASRCPSSATAPRSWS